MSFSNYLETKVLDHVFGGAAYTAPSTLYLALFTSNPNEDASGTEVSAVGTAYVRQAATFTTTGNTASNTSAIEFPTATAAFGVVSHVGLMDASTGGNLLAYAALSSSKDIATGDVFRVPTGDLDISLD